MAGITPGSRLAQAVELEKKARELHAQGKIQEAFHEIKGCLEVFKYVYKWETNPRVKEMVRERMEELATFAEQLKDLTSTPRPAPAQASGAPPVSGATAAVAPPPTAGGGDAAEQDEEAKEKERLRKGLEGAIVMQKPNVRWDDVAGLQAAKDALQETVILPTRFPQLFTGKREPWKGILLYGPPGTGKSHLARATATEADATFYSISSSDLVSKWMGESERLVRSLFEMARESRPSIIFIDEVDSIATARGEGESDAARRIKTEFLAQMDGVGKDSSDLLILGATNVPWDLDSAIRRRFEKRIYIPLPEPESRFRMLQINLGETPCLCTREELMEISERTDRFSGADMKILVRDAIYEPVRRCRRAKTFHRVTREKDGVSKQYWTPCSPGAPGATEMSLMDVPPAELLEPDVLASDFDSALDRVRPSVSEADLVEHEKFTRDFGMEG